MNKPGISFKNMNKDASDKYFVGYLKGKRNTEQAERYDTPEEAMKELALTVAEVEGVNAH